MQAKPARDAYGASDCGCSGGIPVFDGVDSRRMVLAANLTSVLLLMRYKTAMPTFVPSGCVHATTPLATSW